jgi:hypothetical protein
VAQLSAIPNPPTVVTDYSPYAQQALTSNNGGQPDIIEQVLAPAVDVGLLGALNAAGFKGTDFNFSLYDPRVVTYAKGGNTLVDQAPYEQNTPAVKTMTRELLATDPSVVLGQPAGAGYITAEMFIAAIKHVGPSVTGPSLIKSLNSGWTYNGGGLGGSYTFPAAHTGPGECFSIVHSNGIKYSVVVPLTCAKPSPNPFYKKK